jgi:Domain of unknown function (DUF397)
MPPGELKAYGLQWRKASRSANNGACVEVAPGGGGQIFVRDSTARGGPVMLHSGHSWRTFLARVRAGRFDPDQLDG